MAPANKMLVKKSLVFIGDSERDFSWQWQKNLCRFSIFVSKLSPGRQMSSIQFMSCLPIILLSAIAMSSPNVTGAPVRPNGICRYM